MDELITRMVEVVILLYLVSAVMFLIRTVKGPTIFDRVLAVDALSYDLAVFMSLLALYLGEPLLAVSVVILTLWIYVLDIIVSKYMEYEKVSI
jgi:multicomponent Na+:H+ antiporter subunit F